MLVDRPAAEVDWLWARVLLPASAAGLTHALAWSNNSGIMVRPCSNEKSYVPGRHSCVLTVPFRPALAPA